MGERRYRLTDGFGSGVGDIEVVEEAADFEYAADDRCRPHLQDEARASRRRDPVSAEEVADDGRVDELGVGDVDDDHSAALDLGCKQGAQLLSASREPNSCLVARSCSPWSAMIATPSAGCESSI